MVKKGATINEIVDKIKVIVTIDELDLVIGAHLDPKTIGICFDY